tara:strand:- start:500 stop:1153 length:654 start_codon:yes stop_codon:yes gene_type:complete
METNRECIYESKSTKTEYFEIMGTPYIRKKIFGPFSERLCSHEVNVLNRLKGVSRVQQIVEQASPNTFISEYIPGESLLNSRNLAQNYFNELEKILGSIHSHNIADIDFAHSTDLLVDPEGRPAVIDLASSIIYDKQKPSSFLVKPIFDYICSLNYKYLINRKARFQPEQMTKEEWKASPDIGTLAKLWRPLKKYLRKNKEKTSKLINPINSSIKYI